MGTPTNSNPLFVSKGRSPAVRLTAANLAADGSGTPGTDIFVLLTGPTDGIKVNSITFRNSQASPALTSAMRVCAFKKVGASLFILGEDLLAAVTRSNTLRGPAVQFFFPNLFLESGEQILVCKSMHASAADQVDAWADIGDM